MQREKVVAALAQFGVTDVRPAPQSGPSLEPLSAVVQQPVPAPAPTPSPPSDQEVGWALLYFAGEVAKGIAAHEVQYQSYIHGEAATGGLAVANPLSYLGDALTSLSSSGKVIQRAFDKNAASAFGLGGLGGERGAIDEMARDIAVGYGQMLGLGLRVRGATVPDAWKPAVAAFADVVRKPVELIRNWSDQLSSEVKDHVARARAGEHASLNLTLTLDIDTGTFMAEVRKAAGQHDSASDEAGSEFGSVGWGMLAFAEELSLRIAAHEGQYEHYVHGIIESDREVVTDLAGYCHAELDAMAGAVRDLAAAFTPEAHIKAFGPGGRGGDDRAIRKLAEGIEGSYVAFIDAGLRMKAAQAPPQWQRAVGLLADLPKLPLEQIRIFSATLLRDGTVHINGWREQKHDRPLHLTLNLALDTEQLMA